MKEYSFMPFIVKVSILSTLTQSIGAVLNKNILETKYIEDLCSSEKVQELNLSINETAPVLKIKAKNENLTKDVCSCTVVIKSSNGIILNFVSSTGVQYDKHGDSIQILDDNKNSTMFSHHESSHVFKSSVKLTFSSKCCLPEEKFSIIGTAYRRGKFCIDGKEFKCDTGECLMKNYFCDGIKNCPDGSDEIFSKNCISQPNIDPYTKRRPHIDWNMVFPTSKSIVEYRKSFNYTITSAVACAFVIFIFGLLRLLCHYYCSQRETQRQPPPQRPFATFRTFSIIRQRPDFQPEHQCPPPPSYVSLISDRSNNASNGNPPAYSAVVLTEENCPTEANKDNAKNNGPTEPPPPYEP